MNEIINNYLVTLSELIDTITKNEIASMIDRDVYNLDTDELLSILPKYASMIDPQENELIYREIAIKAINPDTFFIKQEDIFKILTIEIKDRDKPTEEVNIKLYKRGSDIVLRELSINRKNFLYEIKKQSVEHYGEYYVLDSEGNFSCSNDERKKLIALMTDKELFKKHITSIYTIEDIEEIKSEYEDTFEINSRTKQKTNLIN